MKGGGLVQPIFTPFSLLAKDIISAESYSHPAPAFLHLLLLQRVPIHWSASRHCHVI